MDTAVDSCTEGGAAVDRLTLIPCRRGEEQRLASFADLVPLCCVHCGANTHTYGAFLLIGQPTGLYTAEIIRRYLCCNGYTNQFELYYFF